MSNTTQQQLNVPAQLIRDLGTGEDVHGLIGKRVRMTDEHPNDFFAAIFGHPSVNYFGAEATVVHVDAKGGIWADFGDNEFVLAREGESKGSRVWDISANGVPEEERIFEVI